MQLWWIFTFAVKKSMLKVWTEGRVVEGALGPEQWAAETFFLKGFHAGDSDDNSKDKIRFGSLITFSSAVKLETLFRGTKSFCTKSHQNLYLSWVRQTVMGFPDDGTLEAYLYKWRWVEPSSVLRKYTELMLSS